MTSLSLPEILHSIEQVLGIPYVCPLQITDIDFALLMFSRGLVARSDIEAVATSPEGLPRQETMLRLLLQTHPNHFAEATVKAYQSFATRAKVLHAMMGTPSMAEVKSLREALVPPALMAPTPSTTARNKAPVLTKREVNNKTETTPSSSAKVPMKRGRAASAADWEEPEEREKREIIEAMAAQKNKEAEKKEKFLKDIKKILNDARSDEEALKRTVALVKKGW